MIVVHTFKKQILDKAFEEGIPLKEAIETSDHAVEVLEGIRKVQEEVKSKEESKKKAEKSTDKKESAETNAKANAKPLHDEAIDGVLKNLSQSMPEETPLQEAVRINLLAELMKCSQNPTAENQSRFESTWEVSKKYLGKTLDVIFAPFLPQTAGAAVPALLAAPAIADSIWISICGYAASNPHALNRMMTAIKSLPSLWVQIKQFAKDLEIKAQKRAEANKTRRAFGWGAELGDEIEKLFVHVKDDSKVESFDEYDDISTGIFERSSKKSSSSTPSRSTMNSGGGSAVPPDPEKEPKQRKIDTPQMQTALKDEKISSGEWHACSDWKKSYESADKTTRFVKTVEKSEFEVYKKVKRGWKHIGVMRPSEGRIRIGKGDNINPDGTIGVFGTGKFAKGNIVK